MCTDSVIAFKIPSEREVETALFLSCSSFNDTRNHKIRGQNIIAPFLQNTAPKWFFLFWEHIKFFIVPVDKCQGLFYIIWHLWINSY